MKKVLMILCALCVGFAYADNVPENKIVSSKEYVDNALVDKQPVFGANANNVAVFTDAAGTVTNKPVSTTLTNSAALPTVGAVNSGLNTKQDEIGGQIVPSGYSQLEYIESTGTQYIDTGYTPNQSTGVQTKLKFNNSVFSNQALAFGGAAANGSKSFEFYIWSQASQFHYDGVIIGSTVSVDDILELNWDRNVINYSINNVQQQTQTFSARTFTATYTMILFGIHRSTISLGMLRMYYFKIYDDDILVRNFVPARRNSDGVLGMYDTVSGTFFTNSGTGTFTAGPTIVPIGATGTVVTYTETPGELGGKGIYQDSGTYAAQTDSLIDAGTFNEALRTVLESEFVCANRPDAYDPVTGNCWLWEISSVPILPSGYTQLGYLESTGTQYIDTGANFLFGDEFFFEYMPIESYSQENKGYGAGTSLAVNITGGGRRSGNTVAMYMNANYSYSPTLSYANTLGRRYTEHWVIDSSTGTLSSVLTDISNNLTYTLTGRTYAGSYNSGNSIYLWRDHSNQYPYYSKARIYHTWLKRVDGTMAFDMIPARRNSDGVLGMYDKVTGQFFTNSGTGTFTAGPVDNVYLPQNQQ